MLLQNLEKAEIRLANKDYAENESYKLIDARSKYLELLFKAYLAENDWRAAENLLLSKDAQNAGFRLAAVAEAAARGNAFTDAVRLWKLQANLNRRNLNNLETLARYEQIKIALRDFYQQMRRREPHSPIPSEALEKLK
jgi:hypothetical protein